MTLPFSVVLITDFSVGRAALITRLQQALEAGPGLAVQLRHPPGVTDRQRFDDGVQVARVCERAGAPLFVNGRLDLSLALGAHLHCTTRSLTVAEARPWLPGRLISVAVHEGEVDHARGADLALVSPVFAPGSKPNDTRPTLGVDGFARLARALACPAFALGGVDVESVEALNGAPVATVTGVLGAPDPRAAARRLLASTRR